MNKKTFFLLLAAIIIAGTFLRFYNLGDESFWLDEAATALTIKNYNVGSIIHNTVSAGQILPGYYFGNLDLPTYYVALKFWANIFGLNEYALRAFSALFGTASIIILYFLAAEIFDKKTALIASFIFSLSMSMIEYSQEARLYMMLNFLVLLSAYFLIKSIKTNKTYYVTLFILANLLGIYTHYPFLFFVIVEAVFIGCLFLIEFINTKKFKLTKINTSFFILFLAYIPLLKYLTVPKFMSTHFAGKISILKLFEIFLQLNTWIYPSLEFKSKLFNFQYTLFSFHEWMVILSVIFVTLALCIFSLKSVLDYRHKKEPSRLFLILWIIIAFCVPFAVLYKSISTFASIRHFLFIVPAYIVLASSAISKLKNKHIALILGAFLVFSVFPISTYYLNANNAQYRQAVSYLEKNAGEKEPVIVNLPSVKVPFDYYSDTLKNTHGVSNVNEAKGIAALNQSVWLVLSTKYADQGGYIKNYFDKNYRLVKSKEFFDVSLFYYSK